MCAATQVPPESSSQLGGEEPWGSLQRVLLGIILCRLRTIPRLTAVARSVPGMGPPAPPYSATLPKSMCSITPRPWVPITIRSAFWELA